VERGDALAIDDGAYRGFLSFTPGSLRRFALKPTDGFAALPNACGPAPSLDAPTMAGDLQAGASRKIGYSG
jgi:hypothetical protein